MLVLSDIYGIPYMVGFTTWFAMCPLQGQVTLSNQELNIFLNF